jgi:bacteriocin-like protein
MEKFEELSFEEMQGVDGGWYLQFIIKNLGFNTTIL